MSAKKNNAFWRVNKKLVKHCGINAALLYADLESKYEYFKNNDQNLFDEWFFNTSKDIEQDTTLSYHKQKAAIEKLKQFNLIESKLMNNPAKLYYRIKKDQLKQFLDLEKLENKNLNNNESKLKNFENKNLNNYKTYNKNKKNNNKNNYIETPENNFLKLNIKVNPYELTEEQKRKRMIALHDKLKNSQIWLTDVSRITRTKESDTWNTIKIFLDELKAKDDFYKPIGDVKKHCVSWIRKYKPPF